MKKLVAGSTAVLFMLSGYLTSCKSTPSESSSKGKANAESSLIGENNASRDDTSEDSETILSGLDKALEGKEQESDVESNESEDSEIAATEEEILAQEEKIAIEEKAEEKIEPAVSKEEEKVTGNAVPEKKPSKEIATVEKTEGEGVIASTSKVKEENESVYNPPNSEENFPETMKRINPTSKPTENTAANLRDGSNNGIGMNGSSGSKKNTGSGTNQDRVSIDADSKGNASSANANGNNANANGTGANADGKDGSNGKNGNASGADTGKNASATSANSANANGKNANASGKGSNADGKDSANGKNGSASGTDTGKNASATGANSANANGKNVNANASGTGSNADGKDGSNGKNGNASGADTGKNANATGANSANASGKNANANASGTGSNADGKDGANGKNGSASGADAGKNASATSANSANANGKNANASGTGTNADGKDGANGKNGSASGTDTGKNANATSANSANKDGNTSKAEIVDNLDKYRTWYSPAMNDIQRCGYFYTTPEICKFDMIQGSFKKISGYSKSAYGFVFGYSEPNGRMLKDYIRFEINVDGEYALYTWDGKNYTDLVEKNNEGTAYFYKNNAIKKGYSSQNDIRIENNGNSFSVYVNNTLIKDKIPLLKNGTKGAMAFFSVGKPDQEDLPATPVNVSMRISDARRAGN